MINPQAENGHIDINHENAEQFARLHLSGNEWQVLWVVLRKTWGWHKKEDSISLSQFEKMTGLSRPSVSEALNKLVGKKVLVVKKEPYINIYVFNKLYSEWIVPKKVLVGFSVSTSRENGKTLVPKKELKLVPKKEHTKEKKETITKETITKDIGTFLQMFSQVNPSYKNLFKNKTERACASRLLEQYGMDKITNLMGQLPSIIQKPYAPSITTPYQLEIKMGQLILFMQQEKKKVNKFKVKKI